MFLRIGQTQIPNIPAAYANSGVLEFEQIVMIEQPAIPKAAASLARPLFHRSMNNGNKVAPKVPAMMEC
jgi:hypothetical protein